MLRRGLIGLLLVQIAAVASLMGGTKVRKMLRGRNVAPLKPAAASRHEIGDGSAASTYTYGAVLFEDMLDAIAGARQRILLESYIIKDDAMGQRFKRALIDASERGVEVYVIYDGFANLVVSRKFFRFPAPVHVLKYPVWGAGWQVFNPRRYGRDHRKILVVDDAVGFVGGYNIGQLYATQWRDTHLRLEGPAVWDLDNAFIDFWNIQRPAHLPEIGPLTSAAGCRRSGRTATCRVSLMFPIRGMYLEAIDRANHSIDITAAYFIPDRDILNALLEASRRGVRVRILVPKVSNHVVTDWLSRGFYGRLLRGGVEIHRYTSHMVHAKTATIDGQWTTIGTANIDRLSLTGNYEINLEILDAGLAQGMYEVFSADLSKADRLDLHEWESRPFINRLYEAILRPLRPPPLTLPADEVLTAP
ncbi:phosphatidylserine/phosphatidylglycerophosphate/cardiolipin synthase family protein [Aeromicrobium sp. UC242_57]